MSTLIARSALASAEQVRELAANVCKLSADEARAAHDRIGVAREWAKLQHDAEQILDDLRFLEARLLARVAELNAEGTVLSAVYRKAARHFSTLDDADLSRFLHEHVSSTALGSYQRFERQGQTDRLIRKGRQSITGRRHVEGARFVHRRFADDAEDAEIGEVRAAAERIISMRAAVALIVSEYVPDYAERFTTSDVVESFIYDNPLHESDTWQQEAYRQGLREALRGALTSAPVATTERSDWIPRFITVYETDADQWVRIPSELATVGDVRRMVADRRGQIAAMQRAADALESLIRADDDDDAWFRNDKTALERRFTHQGRSA